MEILSTGEKIKRARIYKGYTLKELCDNKISVSKMSCIENDKVKPEEWVLKFIANKLEVDLLYLKQDIKDQLAKNINDIVKSNDTKDHEEILKYNFKFARDGCYSDICFQILHLLFNCYLNKEELEKAQHIVHNYYYYLQKCFSYERTVVYYIDIAKWFLMSREFLHAVNYYNNAIDISLKIDNKGLLIKALYYQAMCYFEMDNYEKSYELANKIMDLMDFVEEDIKKAKIYHLMALLSLKTNIGEFKEYEKKVDIFYGKNLRNKARALFDYACAMFILDMKDSAIHYLIKAEDMYPKDDIKELVRFQLMIVDIFIKNEVLDKAQYICDMVLNYAIFLNNIECIERAYYYKAVILIKQGNFEFGEMYMNLSLDTLLKFATNTKIYKRYIKMGEMYYKMGSVSESIKYFDFAIKLEQKYDFL
ncbi:helix-turn-helix domain-containing protein [Clostridium sp. BJN0013]|uniref:helix-turn-helix domain-containing protein n=1 Tax=Clostridium sp. BJN0013 TaxID=3236840 RepID=UPI0034C61406